MIELKIIFFNEPPVLWDFFLLYMTASTSVFHVSTACLCASLKYLEIIREDSIIDFLLPLE